MIKKFIEGVFVCLFFFSLFALAGVSDCVDQIIIESRGE